MYARSLQLGLTFCGPMDCSPPGFSVHENSPGKNNEVGCHAFFQGIFPTRGSNSGLLHCRQILYHLSLQGSPDIVPIRGEERDRDHKKDINRDIEKNEREERKPLANL